MSNWFVSRALHNFVSLPKIETYLEVGVWEGDSFFWVLKNLQPSFAIGVDPYPDDNKRKGGINKLIGYAVQAKWRSEFSDVSGVLVRENSLTALPKLLVNHRESFDLVYIDGSHHGLDVFCDAAMAIQLVKPGGHVIFDDFGAHVLRNVYGLRLAVDTIQRLAVDDFEVAAVNSQVVMRRFETSTRTVPISRCKIRESILPERELSQLHVRVFPGEDTEP